MRNLTNTKYFRSDLIIKFLCNELDGSVHLPRKTILRIEFLKCPDIPSTTPVLDTMTPRARA